MKRIKVDSKKILINLLGFCDSIVSCVANTHEDICLDLNEIKIILNTFQYLIIKSLFWSYTTLLIYVKATGKIKLL